MSAATTTNTGLRFRISSTSYWQVADWRSRLDQEILRHQIETRGHALVMLSGGNVAKIVRVPGVGEREPYYGSLGGAYRYSFRPIETRDYMGCELEVSNLMCGFAYYYPRRTDPLRVFVPTYPEPFPTKTSELSRNITHAREIKKTGSLTQGELRFSITNEAYQTLLRWPCYGRELSAYEFIFTPTTKICLTRVRLIQGGDFIDLVREEAV